MKRRPGLFEFPDSIRLAAVCAGGLLALFLLVAWLNVALNGVGVIGASTGVWAVMLVGLGAATVAVGVLTWLAAKRVHRDQSGGRHSQ